MSIQIGDRVRIRENSRFYADWAGAVVTVMALHMEPDGTVTATISTGAAEYRTGGWRGWEGVCDGWSLDELDSLAEPPADAEVTSDRTERLAIQRDKWIAAHSFPVMQAERAVIEAATALLPTKFHTLTQAWRIDKIKRAVQALIAARQRSDAAKEQG